MNCAFFACLLAAVNTAVSPMPGTRDDPNREATIPGQASIESERQPSAVAAPRFHLCNRAAEAPPWTVPFGREFWRCGIAQSNPAKHAIAGVMVSPEFGLGEVIERVSLALRQTGASTAAADAASFQASFDGSGLSFSPHLPSAKEARPRAFPDGIKLPTPDHPPAPARLQRDPETRLSLRTLSVRRGETSLFAPLSNGHPWSFLGNTAQVLLSEAAALVEHYEVRRQGVEVAWVLAHAPDGTGDLRLDLDIAGLAFLAHTVGGLHFADAAGRARVCVGAAKLVDSAGRSWPVEMQLQGTRLSLVVAEAALAAATYPAAIDPLISPEFGLDSPLLLPAGASQYSPDVAWNGSEFFVVWQDERYYGTSAHDIFGARVSATGQVLDPAGIAICTAPYTQEHPRVASDGTNFLAVWADRRLTGDMSDIYGARISASGQVLDPNGIVICDEGWWDGTPAIAFNGTNYLVVWDDQRNDSTPPRWRDIFGTRIRPDGTLLDPGGIPIKTGPDDENAPSVAACGGDFLVTWHAGPQTVGTYFHIYAARVTGDGGVPDAGGFPVCTAANDQWWPEVTSDGQQYLVAWLDNRNAATAGDIYAARVTTNGLVLDPDGFPVCTTAGGGLPTATAQGTNFLVLWADSRSGNNDLYQARINSAGSVLDPEGVPLCQAPGDQGSPRIARVASGKSLLVWADSRNAATASDVQCALLAEGGTVTNGAGTVVTLGLRSDDPPAVASLGSEFLVVWADRRNADTNGLDLFGTRVTATGTVLDPAGLAICTAPGDQSTPAITAGSGQYFVVWSDGRNAQTDIFGTRISPTGAVLDANGIAICSATGDQRQPDVAACGSNYFVTWFDLRNSSSPDLYLGRVRADGTVLDGSGVAFGTTLYDGPQLASDGDDVLAVWVRTSRDLVARRFDQAAGQIGTDLTLAPASPNAPFSPAVAGGPLGYLVAWRDQRNYAASLNDIFASRVDRNGALLDAAGINVCSAVNHQVDPRVAANGGNYLVAWTDYRNSNFQDIYAARVTGTGATLDVAGFVVNTATSNERFPRAAYSADSDVFLVASQSDASGVFRTIANLIAAPETPPAVWQQPQTQYVNTGEHATFAVTAIGPPPLGYQWFFSGSPVGGATQTSFTVTNAADSNIGPYFVTVSNLYGVATSSVASLFVDALPTIVTNPSSTAAFAGSNVTLQVSAVGSPPLHFQWRFESVPISGATDAVFALPNVQFTNQGRYDVIITNRYGGAQSPMAVLMVYSPPYIIAQPESQSVGFGTNVTFQVQALGSLPLRYQWTFNAAPVAGATNSSYTVTNALANHSGIYAVVVTNPFGSVTSSAAMLSVTSSPPVIVGQPASRTVTKGAEVGFNVTALGTTPLGYQWHFNNSPLPGVIGSSLLLTNAPYAAAGAYSAVVTNIYGATTSALATLVVTNPPGFLWARQGNIITTGQGNAVAVDSARDVIVAGSFTGTMTLGSTNMLSAGSSDAFLAKYDPAGNLLWAWQAGDVNADYAFAVAAALNGDVLVAGRFFGTVNFDGTTLTHRGSGDGFLARLDRDGHLLWVQQGGGSPGVDTAYAVAVDADGNAYLAGTFDTWATFGTTTLYASGSGFDAFVVKYNPAGNVIWARRCGGTGDDQARAVAVDSTGSVFLAGYFNGSASFGTNTLVSFGGQDVFITKLDAVGNFLWANKSGGAANDLANGLAVDSSGNAFVAGTFSSTTNVFNGGVILSNTSSASEVFLAKFSGNGALLWARSAGGTYMDNGNAVALDSAGNAYLGGSFFWSANFSGKPVSGAYANAFVANYAPDGSLGWVRASMASPSHAALGIAVDDRGGVYETGYFQGTASFDHVTLSNASLDFFLSKLAAFDDEAPPFFTSQPAGQTVLGGTNVTLTGGALGTGPLSFQWLLNGTNLPGATNSTLTWSIAVSGNFTLVVSNVFGAATSAVAVVSVRTSPDFLWTLGFGGASNDAVQAVAVNPANGDLYVAGYFSDSVAISGTNLVSAGAEDIFIAKFDSNRAPVWVQQAGGPGADRPTGLALDAAGRVYVTGTFTGTAAFGPPSLTSAGGADAFLWSLEASGLTRWAKRGGGTGNDTSQGLAVDASGNTVIAGTFQQSALFDSSSVISGGGATTNNAFFARYNSAGGLVWAEAGAGARAVVGRAVAMDANSRAYICGSFAGSATFGGRTLTSLAGLDLFVARYSASRSSVWAMRAGTLMLTNALWDDEALAIAADASGGFVVAGTFTGTAQFGSNTLFSVATNQPNLFVARFDTNGTALWTAQTRGRLAQSARALALDAAGNVFVAGYYSDAASFDAETLGNAGGSDAFVAMYDAVGRLVKVSRAGGVTNDTGLGVCANRGTVYLAGSFADSAAFGNDLLTSAGGTDGFVSALSFFAPDNPPVITTSPRSQLVALMGSPRADTNAWFTVGVQGGFPLSYQWRLNGADLPGATNATFSLASVPLSSAGQYSVMVSNAYGSAISSPALLTFDVPSEFVWARKAGGTLDDTGYVATVDLAGNLCVAGTFSGTATFGTNTLISGGGTDGFIAKCDPAGNFVWANRLTGAANDVALALTADATGHLLLAGHFASPILTLGSLTVTNTRPGYSDLFVAKLSNAGTPLWLQRAGGPANIALGQDQASAVAVDAQGNVFVTGYFSDRASFGSLGVTNVNCTNFFLAKYDADGNPLWVAGATGSSKSQGTGVTVAKDGSLYVTGSYRGAPSFGPFSLTNSPGTFNTETVFLAKYSADGVVQWAKTRDGVTAGFGKAIFADPAGNVYLSAYRPDYGTSPFLARYDPLGNLVWSFDASISCCTGDSIVGNALALDEASNLLVAGTASGSASLGTNSIYRQGFLAKFGADGTLVAVTKLGATANGLGNDHWNSACIAGGFSGTMAFGTAGNLTSSGGNDIYLAKLGVRPPTAQVPPTNRTVVVGSNAILSGSASGTAPLEYQWQFNGTNLAGATSASLTLSNFTPDQAGNYRVIVRNPAGAVTNDVAVLTAIPVIHIASDGQQAVLSWPGSFVLQSATNLAGPFVDIPGATSPFTNALPPSDAQAFYRLRSGN